LESFRDLQVFHVLVELPELVVGLDKSKGDGRSLFGWKFSKVKATSTQTLVNFLG
jgi:hypothetical protein